MTVSRSPLNLAALATVALPGFTPVGAQPTTGPPGTDAALVQDSHRHRWTTDRSLATRAVGVDQPGDLGRLHGLLVRVQRPVGGPAHRLVGQAQGGEDPVVEAVLAEQLGVHDLEELAGLRALDDPV